MKVCAQSYYNLLCHVELISLRGLPAFFFKGNRRGVVGWEGEVARRRTGKSRGRGKCDLDAKHERIKEKKIT